MGKTPRKPSQILSHPIRMLWGIVLRSDGYSCDRPSSELCTESGVNLCLHSESCEYCDKTFCSQCFPGITNHTRNHRFRPLRRS
jgi:hypothetical protein